MKVLLDTTVLIDFLRNRSDARSVMHTLNLAEAELCTSAINVAEVDSGLRPGEERETANLFAQLRIIPITVSLAIRAGLLRSQWSRKGKTLELTDMIVASTALELDLALITDNRKDFPMPELRFYELP